MSILAQTHYTMYMHGRRVFILFGKPSTPSHPLFIPPSAFPILPFTPPSCYAPCIMLSSLWFNIPQSQIPGQTCFMKSVYIRSNFFWSLSVLINWDRRARAGRNRIISTFAFIIPPPFLTLLGISILKSPFFNPFWGVPPPLVKDKDHLTSKTKY